MKHIVIIGNGIAGVTAARHIRKASNHRITIISSETPHFFSRTALMYIYMGHMTFEHTKPYPDSFWSKNSIELKQGHVTQLFPERKSIQLKDGSEMNYDSLILALGSKPNFFGWPGQDLKGVQGLYSFQDLQKLETYAPNPTICNRAVIVGGGLIGVELAEMLHSRNISVTFLVRESSFWNGVLTNGDSALVTEHIHRHGIDLRLNSNLKEIKGDSDGKVKSVIIEETGEEIECQFVGLTAGVRPNVDFLKESTVEIHKGILVNPYLETNLPDVYAIGDCAELKQPQAHRRAIEAVWYVGRMMGETVAQTICGNRMEYKPGHWFNSAKFFNLEYQTYGQVSASAIKGSQELQFHWRHPEEEKAMTFAYDAHKSTFLGLNTLGIRLRHDVLDRWLSENRTIHEVIQNLEEAHFDPEFYRKQYPLIRNSFVQLQNTQMA